MPPRDNIIRLDELHRDLRFGRRVRPAPIVLHRQVARDDAKLNAEPITWGKLIGAFALALVAFAVIYFGGHFVLAGFVA